MASTPHKWGSVALMVVGAYIEYICIWSIYIYSVNSVYGVYRVYMVYMEDIEYIRVCSVYIVYMVYSVYRSLPPLGGGLCSVYGWCIQMYIV